MATFFSQIFFLNMIFLSFMLKILDIFFVLMYNLDVYMVLI